MDPPAVATPELCLASLLLNMVGPTGNKANILTEPNLVSRLNAHGNPSTATRRVCPGRVSRFGWVHSRWTTPDAILRRRRIIPPTSTASETLLVFQKSNKAAFSPGKLEPKFSSLPIRIDPLSHCDRRFPVSVGIGGIGKSDGWEHPLLCQDFPEDFNSQARQKPLRTGRTTLPDRQLWARLFDLVIPEPPNPGNRLLSVDFGAATESREFGGSHLVEPCRLTLPCVLVLEPRVMPKKKRPAEKSNTTRTGKSGKRQSKAARGSGAASSRAASGLDTSVRQSKSETRRRQGKRTIRTPASPTGNVIRVRGARTHNLKQVDIDVPRDQLVVITGRSGSGKSSLAFDTIYAEGQRQYIETLSVYARQFLGQMQRPDSELIDGLQPTLCIDQKNNSASPRSTVGTITEIYDYLRLLMSKAGVIHCRGCGDPISQQTQEEIARQLLQYPPRTRLMLLAPMVRGRKGAHAEVLERIRKAGMVRVQVDGQLYDIDSVPKLAVRKEHDISAVVDRIALRDGIEGRLSESLRLALKLGDGMVVVMRPSEDDSDTEAWDSRLFSTHSACLQCGISYGEILPRTFSFNSPYGACPECDGLGTVDHFVAAAVIPDRDLALRDGAIAPWRELSPAARETRMKKLRPIMKQVGLRIDTPLAQLDPERWETFLNSRTPKLPGLFLQLEKELATTTSDQHLERLQSIRGQVSCQACNGSRLGPDARQVKLSGVGIDEIVSWDILQAQKFFRDLEESSELTGVTREVARAPLREIIRRLQYLEDVSVTYLSLGRNAATLSGGELQRVRLATAIGTGLTHVCFVLDEPSIGLHQRDNQLLINVLHRLRDEGNSVLVVEHDEEVMRAADWIIDMGPGAGEHGGTIVGQGDIETIKQNHESSTARFLNGEQVIRRATEIRDTDAAQWIELKGARFHNLQSVDVRLPLGRLICVTGVSGSGKSSLIHDTLGAALQRHTGSPTVVPGPYDSLTGADSVEQVIRVDQSSIGRSSRSNTATYTGVFDEVRKVFARTRLAKQLGFTSSRFSFNSVQGRCPQCEGHGQQRIEMKFLPDLFVLCPLCRGARFNSQTLRVKFKEATIADVLEMSCGQARDFFSEVERIHRVLDALCQVGLDYLPLGQPSTTLSGGEAQRIKLATRLARPQSGNAFYILDEPTTGLHFEDIQKLLDVLDLLVEQGNTVLVVEHNLDLIANADWILDMGPDGGRFGGQVVAAGTPAEVVQQNRKYTAHYLKPVWERLGRN